MWIFFFIFETLFLYFIMFLLSTFFHCVIFLSRFRRIRGRGEYSRDRMRKIVRTQYKSRNHEKGTAKILNLFMSSR